MWTCVCAWDKSCAVAGTLAHIQEIYLNGMHFKLYKTKFLCEFGNDLNEVGKQN